MQIIDWRPAKPKRLTPAMWRAGDRAIAQFARLHGRRPQSGVIYFDAKLRRLERIEFEPTAEAPP